MDNIQYYIDKYDLPEDMYFLSDSVGLLSNSIVINKGEYIFFNENSFTHMTGTICTGGRYDSNQKYIKTLILKSEKYNEHLRKKLRIKKLKQLNDK